MDRVALERHLAQLQGQQSNAAGADGRTDETASPCSVAAIVSVKHPSKFAGGVIVRHDRFQPATSCEVL